MNINININIFQRKEVVKDKRVPAEIAILVAEQLIHWDMLCACNQKPILEKGEKKRDWIGKSVGLKGRQVQEYLTGKYSKTVKTIIDFKEKGL